MKSRILLSLMMLSLLFLGFLTPKRVLAVEENHFVVMKTAEVSNGDTISLERDTSFNYRVVQNGNKAVDVKLKNKNCGFIRFFEAVNYYVFYGSLMPENDIQNTTPFIYRINKNFTSDAYYFDEEATGAAHFINLIEFSVDYFVLNEFTSGSVSIVGYNGTYGLSSFNENLEKIAFISIGEEDCSLRVAYDVLEVETIYHNFYYFDRNFKMVDSYKKEETIYGSFELSSEAQVNGKNYPIGSSFNLPGDYFLEDGFHEGRLVHLDPLVKGVTDGNIYHDYVEYQISGGSLFLNGQPVYLNGVVSETGSYVLKIVGLNEFEREIRFIIAPKLLTEVQTGDSLNIGDEINFTGYAKINDGDFIQTSFEIKDPGSYKLSLYLNESGDPTETIYFTVPEISVTKNQKVWIYLVEGFVILGIMTTVGIVILSEIKKKKKAF